MVLFCFCCFHGYHVLKCFPFFFPQEVPIRLHGTFRPRTSAVLGTIPLQQINGETPRFDGISVPTRPAQPSAPGSRVSSPRAAAGPRTSTQPSACGAGAGPGPLSSISNPKSCPRSRTQPGEGIGWGGKRAGGWKQTPLPPVPPARCGSCFQRAGACRAGAHGGARGQGCRGDAVPPVPAVRGLGRP